MMLWLLHICSLVDNRISSPVPGIIATLQANKVVISGFVKGHKGVHRVLPPIGAADQQLCILLVRELLLDLQR